MRFGILGTGVVGKTMATRLAGLGHDVMVGTRDPQVTLSRTDPDQYGNPSFSAWQQEHPEVKLETFGDAAAHGERWSSTQRPAPSRWRRSSRLARRTLTARSS
jgi:8-hydroxy-5-deazaflavin:NADPH oxidoreductase